MAKQNLFIDFDSTITNSIKSFCETYNVLYKDKVGFVPADYKNIKSYDFSCVCPLLKTQEQRKEIWEDHNFFSLLEFINKDTKDVLIKLNEKYNITVVSIGTLINIVLKAAWSSIYLPFINNYVLIKNANCKTDKSMVNMEGGILIDDMPPNLEGSNAKEKILFGKIYYWNKNWKGEHCANWSEIAKRLL